jgi:site-specific recombinase
LRPKKETADSAILSAATNLYTNIKTEMTDTKTRLAAAEAEIVKLRRSIDELVEMHRKEMIQKDAEIQKWQRQYFDQTKKTDSMQASYDAQIQMLKMQLMANNIKPLEFVAQAQAPVEQDAHGGQQPAHNE